MGFSRQEYWSGLPRPPQGLFLTHRLNLCLLCPLRWLAGSLPRSHLEVSGPDVRWDKSGKALGLFAWAFEDNAALVYFTTSEGTCKYEFYEI